MKQFKVGDVVQLNSGGPEMTVIYFNGKDADCRWHEQGKMNSDSFPADALTLVDQDQSFPGADGDDPTD